ncbi:MAG TPA: hypothetical protein VK694_07625 [Verrucomicrobiae bacterium]|nr:hypothetical protein [Verrucomicrobiae bacterium]
MKGLKTERKGLPGAGKPAWIARGLARGENGDLFVVIEVVMNKEGHLIRYHPTYLDGSGTLIGRPRIGDDEAATNTTTPAKEYIEPAKDPEAYMPSEAIPPASVDLGPGYQLRAESQ